MKPNINNLLEYQLQFKSAIAYLVPTKWWKQFCSCNQNAKTKQELTFPSLSLEKHVDTFLLEFQESIAAELEHKSNYLKFNKIFLSPQIKKGVEWTLISSDVWNIVSSKTKPRFALITMYNEQDPYSVLTQNQIQLQVIFCSRTKSDAFVGFLPQLTDLIAAVRAIGYELGYVEMNNSRIIFPDKNPDRSHYYCELQNKTLAQSQDTLLLAYNLEFVQQKDDKNQILNYSFGKGDEMANSNQAMAGDIGVIGIESFQQPRNDGTMSTGAETPSFFGSEEENFRQFRVRELFREKKPQQIQQLRAKAKKIVKGSLIAVRQQSEHEMEQSLDVVVMELMEHISMHKKKTYKQKQNHHQ